MAAMRHDDVAEATRPVLRALEGGRKADRRTAAEFAHVERIAGLDEAIEGASLVYGIVSDLAADADDGLRPTDLRWRLALNGLGRIVHRATAAREEIRALTDGPDGSAA